MWLLIKYMLLRPSVNMCVSHRVVCMVLIVMSIALSSALRIFWYPNNLFDIWVLLLRLYTPELVVLPSISPLGVLEGGINDSSVYMHCCGWYLRGWVWLYVVGRGVVMMLLGGGLYFGAIFPCLGEFNVVVCGGGFYGLGVYVCVFVILFRTLCNSCGVCKFIVGFISLCMYMMDVSDGYVYW